MLYCKSYLFRQITNILTLFLFNEIKLLELCNTLYSGSFLFGCFWSEKDSEEGGNGI